MLELTPRKFSPSSALLLICASPSITVAQDIKKSGSKIL